MKHQQNTIKLNGRLFDAVSGNPVDGSPIPSQVHVKASAKHQASGQPHPSKAHKPVATGTVKQASSSVSRQPHNTHRKTQHSKTLMRHSVKKPARIAHKITDLQAPQLASHNIESGTSLDIMAIKHGRSKHAASVARSHLIHRFNSHYGQTPTVVKRVTHLSVKAAPDEPTIEKHSVAPVSNNLSTDLFTNALASATSHNQTLQQHTKRQRVAKKLGISTRALHVTIGVLVLMALGNLIFYKNMPNIRVHMAASSAGIHATMPGYQPAGFALDNKIQASDGQVVLSFHSNTDGRNFKIIQATAPSDVGAIANNLGASTGQSYQAVTSENGATIYFYGDSNAAWVKGNTWYTIEGNSNLSLTQIQKIANSF